MTVTRSRVSPVARSATPTIVSLPAGRRNARLLPSGEGSTQAAPSRTRRGCPPTIGTLNAETSAPFVRMK